MSDTPRLFRMILPKLPGFNVYSHIARKTTALGPLSVATAAAQLPGWEVEVIDENNYRFPGPHDAHGAPDHAFLQLARPAAAVGFYGGLTCGVPRLYELARWYQEQGVLTVAGGHHFLGQADEGLANGVDIVVHGEGEYAMQEILRAAEGGRDFSAISGISYRQDGREVCTPDRPPIADLDALPYPDFNLLRYAKVAVYPISRIRGCGMDCEFCAIKGKPRWAKPERLLNSIIRVVEQHGWHSFFVVDDHFGQERAGTLAFCRLAAQWQKAVGKRLDISIQVRLDTARDTELLQAMREAGVLTVAIGYESVDDEVLKTIGKHIRAADMLAYTRAYREAGFLVHGMFILGYPAHPGQESGLHLDRQMCAYEKFIRVARLDTLQVLNPVPLPGTALRARLAAQGRLYPLDELGWDFYDGNFPLFMPDAPVTATEQLDGVLRLLKRFYHFHHLLLVGLRTLYFPIAFLPLINIRAHWHRWYRAWRNNIRGFGGWLLIRKLTGFLDTGDYHARLQRAEARLRRE